MTDAGPRARSTSRRAVAIWRSVSFEQKVAVVGALLLIVSTFGPFSFVEAAEVLVALGVLALVGARGEGRRFHLPFGDGTVVMAAGIWAAILIVIRLFDRSLGQNLLALACAAVLGVAGAAERAKRPPDDLPDQEPVSPRPSPTPPDEAPTRVVADPPADSSRTETASPPPGDSPPAGRPRSPRS
jgi:hypothetical protein